MGKFRTKLNSRERKEAFLSIGEPKCQHQATLCFGGLKFVSIKLELPRAVFRSEIKEDLREYLLEKFKPMFKGLTNVIVHN